MERFPLMTLFRGIVQDFQAFSKEILGLQFRQVILWLPIRDLLSFGYRVFHLHSNRMSQTKTAPKNNNFDERKHT